MCPLEHSVLELNFSVIIMNNNFCRSNLHFLSNSHKRQWIDLQSRNNANKSSVGTSYRSITEELEPPSSVQDKVDRNKCLEFLVACGLASCFNLSSTSSSNSENCPRQATELANLGDNPCFQTHSQGLPIENDDGMDIFNKETVNEGEDKSLASVSELLVDKTKTLTASCSIIQEFLK